MRTLVFLLIMVPGIICPPVTVRPPTPVEKDPDVKPVQDDVVGRPLDISF